jgi:hypothetical protein
MASSSSAFAAPRTEATLPWSEEEVGVGEEEAAGVPSLLPNNAGLALLLLLLLPSVEELVLVLNVREMLSFPDRESASVPSAPTVEEAPLNSDADDGRLASVISDVPPNRAKIDCGPKYRSWSDVYTNSLPLPSQNTSTASWREKEVCLGLASFDVDCRRVSSAKPFSNSPVGPAEFGREVVF